MRRTITKILIFIALANILIGIVLLLSYRYTALPLVEWLRSLRTDELELLLSFLAKLEIALGLLFLVAAALVGRRVLDR